MATKIGSSTFSGSNGGHFFLDLYYDLLSQSIADNSSTIRLYAYIGSYDGWSAGGASANVYIDGNYVGSVSGIAARSNTLVGTLDRPIGHNSVGAGSFSSSASCSTPWNNVGSATASGSANLPTIPRQANITEAPNFNDEENPTIKYSNPAGNNVTSLQACIANSTGSTIYVPYRDISKTGSSYKFELTDAERTALRNATPNSNSLSVRFYVKTVLGGSTYYSNSTKTMTIVNGNPIFDDFEFKDINEVTVALTGNDMFNINGYSNIQVTVPNVNKAEAVKSASMSKYRFVIGDVSTDITYSDSDDVSGVIENATSGVYNVYAIDSRNNSKLVPKMAESVISYEPLYVNKTTSSLARDNNQVGTNAVLTLNGTLWNNSFGIVDNSIKNVSYKLKKTDSSTWIDGTTSIQLTVSDNTFTFSGMIASDNQDTSWDLDDSYNVKVIIEDELSSTEIDFILPSAVPTMSLDKKGVGIMCAYDESIGGYLQVNGKKFVSIDEAHPVGSLFFTKDANFDPNVAFGGTWQKITGKFLYANGGSSYTDGNGTGTSTNSHTLTSGQLPKISGRFGVNVVDNYEELLTGPFSNGGVIASKNSAVNNSVRNVYGINFNIGNNEGHSHNIPFFAPFVWERTA